MTGPHDAHAPGDPTPDAPALVGMPRVLERVEGGMALLIGLAMWAALGYGWGWLALLLFLPDLSAAGCLAGPRAGAVAYNLAHTYAVALLAVGAGWVANGYQGVEATWLGVAAVFVAHIGLDRMLGYGLKYPTRFSDTHLGRIGRRATRAKPGAQP